MTPNLPAELAPARGCPGVVRRGPPMLDEMLLDDLRRRGCPSARRCNRGGHGVEGLALATVVLLLLVTSMVWIPTPAAGAETSHLRTSVTVQYNVTGTVDGYSQSRADSGSVPIAGDAVSAVPNNCTPFFNSSGTCSPIANTTTNASGVYTLSLANGSYDVYSSPDGVFGGDTRGVTVSGGNTTAPTMHAYLELRYSNTTYVLPGFNALSGYVSDHSGTQVPVLSYTSDGVFYINSSHDLVYYSFSAATVRMIAPWDMLYDQIGYVGELNNYFYLTLDGAYAYEMGCVSAGCGGTNLLVEYAVNVTTGRSFTWDTGVTQRSTISNSGVYLLGRHGNDTLMALVTSDGTVRLYDPWNATAWNAGKLSFFEANNVYWVPFLDSLINVQAAGTATDKIEQMELEGPASGTGFVRVFGPVVNGPGGVKSNGVDGLVFNLTLNEMAYNYGSSASGSVQTVYSLTHGVLSTMLSYNVVKTAPYGRFVSDDHRLSVSTGDPVVNGYYNPDFYNLSWVSNPFSGQFYDTNVQEGFLNHGESSMFDSAAGYDGEPAHQFLNASNAITGYSVNCANATGKVLPCPLLGTTVGTTLGTVYYVSELSEGQFPYPASTPIAQPAAPAPLVLTQTANGSVVTVTWAHPSLYPVLNFTFYWGAGPTALTHQVNLPSTAGGYTISGLTPGEQVYYGATVTDLNYVSPMSTGSVVTPGATVPSPPTGLRAVADGATAVNLSWINPNGPLTNITAYFGTSPSGPFARASEGVVTTVGLVGLTPGTQYYFTVTAWNTSGESPMSIGVSATTARLPPPPSAPLNLTATALDYADVLLAWTPPPGNLTNYTVAMGAESDAYGVYYDVPNGSSSTFVVAGLLPSTTYYFNLRAWSTAGAGNASAPANATTLSYPGGGGGTGGGSSAGNSRSLVWLFLPLVAVAGVIVIAIYRSEPKRRIGDPQLSEVPRRRGP